MSQPIIRAALETRLATWAATNSLPVAWENQQFTPPAGAYVRSNLLPAPTGSDTLDGAHRRYSGIYQITLVMPAGTGPAAGEALAAALDGQFPASFTRDGVQVYRTAPMSAAPALQEGDRYVIPCSLRYEAHTV